MSVKVRLRLNSGSSSFHGPKGQALDCRGLFRSKEDPHLMKFSIVFGGGSFSVCTSATILVCRGFLFLRLEYFVFVKDPLFVSEVSFF